MTVQQLSTGGTSAAGGSPSSITTTGGFNMNDFLAMTGSTPAPNTSLTNLSNNINAPYQITSEADPNSIFIGVNGPEGGSPDPFQLNPIYNSATGGGAPTSETQSPGYQAYGQDWVNLVNAIGNPTEAQAASEANAFSSFSTDPDGGGGGYTPNMIGRIPTGQINLNTNFPLSPGSQLAEQVYLGSGNTQLASQIQPQVAAALGIDPNSPDAATYANAYITYIDQVNGRNNITTGVNEANRAGSFEGIVGDIGQVLGYSAAGGAVGWAAGAADAAAIAAADTATIAEASTEAAASTEVAADASVVGAASADLGASAAEGLDTSLSAADQLSLFKGVEELGQGLSGLSTGRPVSALGSVLSAGSNFGGDLGSLLHGAGIATNLGQDIASGNPMGYANDAINLGGTALRSGTPSETTPGSTNSPTAGSAMSSVANTVGLTPDQLDDVISGLGLAGSVASVATPLVTNMLNAPSSSDITTSGAGAAPPPPTITAPPPGAPAPGGSALTPISIDNPAQDDYSDPSKKPLNLGGGTQNLDIAQLLKALALQRA